jgi:hypothetical protein
VADRAQKALGLRRRGDERGGPGFGEKGFEAMGEIGALMLEVDEKPGVVAGDRQRTLARRGPA